MEPPPLSLQLYELVELSNRRLRLTPSLLLPGVAASPEPVPPPERATPIPPLPDNFSLSPTSNYPAPYGAALLGEHLSASFRLSNATNADVKGVKMMLEVQSPAARVRLGEIVHGGPRPDGAEPATAEARPWEELPSLLPGDGMDIDIAHDVAELGQHILICSVAWETPEGRRTFQRFLKFNVGEAIPG